MLHLRRLPYWYLRRLSSPDAFIDEPNMFKGYICKYTCIMLLHDAAHEPQTTAVSYQFLKICSKSISLFLPLYAIDREVFILLFRLSFL